MKTNTINISNIHQLDTVIDQIEQFDPSELIKLIVTFICNCEKKEAIIKGGKNTFIKGNSKKGKKNHLLRLIKGKLSDLEKYTYKYVDNTTGTHNYIESIQSKFSHSNLVTQGIMTGLKRVAGQYFTSKVNVLA